MIGTNFDMPFPTSGGNNGLSSTAASEVLTEESSREIIAIGMGPCAQKQKQCGASSSHTKKQKYRPVLVDNKTTSTKRTTITPVDMDVLRGLESDYVTAKQESMIGEQARRAWASKAAMISILFIVVYLTAGIIFFSSQTDWALPDTILFAVYSATSAGYGHLDIPRTALFQMVDTVYILIGIASLAIMVAQVYQFLQLEASRAEDQRRALELASAVAGSSEKRKNRSCLGDLFWSGLDRVRPFFKETHVGRFLAVFLPLAALAMTGACIIGAIEGWTFVECVYFGVVSLTTTGYGDYYPTKTSSILICSFWLPCNIIFTSIYMGSVANWYLNLSAHGVQHIRRSLHAKEVASLVSGPPIATSTNIDIEKGLSGKKVYGDGGDNSSIGSQQELPATHSTESSRDGNREEGGEQAVAPTSVVLENLTATLTTMASVIEVVQKHTEAAAKISGRDDDFENATATESLRFMALQPANDENPCFTLRVLVKQRMAAIIACELAGGNHDVDVQESHIVIRIGSWQEVATKWLIPSGAWKLFRAAALNSMMLVGERTLIKHGQKALLDLSPGEFYSIFSPLLAAMGDAETLQGWMNSTDEMASQYLVENDELGLDRLTKMNRKFHLSEDTVKMPKSQGTAFHKS